MRREPGKAADLRQVEREEHRGERAEHDDEEEEEVRVDRPAQTRNRDVDD